MIKEEIRNEPIPHSRLIKRAGPQGEILFAIVVERKTAWKGTWIWVLDPKPIYMHAFSFVDARARYLQTDPTHKTRIAEVAPVIGFHALDEHGEKLLA